MKKIVFIVGRNPQTNNGEIPLKLTNQNDRIEDSHCKITFEGDYKLIDKNNFYIEDLNTKYGTFVNGNKINKKTKVDRKNDIFLGGTNHDDAILFDLRNKKIEKLLLKNGFKKLNKYNYIWFIGILIYILLIIISKKYHLNSLRILASILLALTIFLIIYKIKKQKQAKILEENIKSSQFDNGINLDNIEIPNKIRELSKLKEQGIITEEEFSKKKSELLNKL